MAKVNRRKETAKRLAARLERVRKVMADEDASKKAFRAELLDSEDPTGLDEMFEKPDYDLSEDYEEQPIDSGPLYTPAPYEEQPIDSGPLYTPAPFGAFGWLAKDKTVSIISMNDWVNRMVNSRHNHILSRRVGLTKIEDAEVSTVFIGINAGRPPLRPIWFETFVMGGELDGHKELYMTWEEAETGHETIVGMIRVASEQRKKVVQQIERTRRDNRVR